MRPAISEQLHLDTRAASRGYANENSVNAKLGANDTPVIDLLPVVGARYIAIVLSLSSLETT